MLREHMAAAHERLKDEDLAEMDTPLEGSPTVPGSFSARRDKL